MRSHPCLFCKNWYHENDMLQHLADVHEIRKQQLELELTGETPGPGQ